MRLIDADVLKEALHKRQWYIDDIEEVLSIIDNAPTVEILPENVIEAHTKIGYERGFNDGYAKCVEDNERPQGEWVHLQAIGDYKCSICGAENLYKYANEHERWIKTNSNFCPNCGADMKGSAE